jgi:small subunit ribosomal protein S6
MTPVLSEEQMKETVNDYKELLKGNNAKIVHEDNWGLRKLTYPIKKKSTGFYYLIEFEAKGEIIADLELAYKRDERLLRFLTVKMDKHAVAFAEKRRGLAKESKGNKKVVNA